MMSKLKFEKQKYFFERKGFYIALSVCLIAIGSASYTAVSGYNNKNLTSDDISDTTYSYTENVDNNLPDQPYPNSSEIISSSPKNVISDTLQADSSSDVSSEKNTAAQFFVMPLGGEIIKEFSEDELQYSETYKDWRMHMATDITGEKGAAVCSAGDGVVKDIYSDELFGTIVVIDHGNGIIAKYCGLNKKPTVETGSIVEAGTQLGALDEIPCESVEQIHLHLEMTLNGKPISPAEYIKSSSLLG